jgi:acid phosphatase class B
LGRALQGLARGVKMQARRGDRAVFLAARKKVREIQVIGVGVSLEAAGYISKLAAVLLAGSHDIRAKIDQEIIIDQCRGALAQTWAA